MPKEIVLRGLVDSMKGVEPGDPETVLIQLLKREQESSTFLNEGVAFPHLRIEGLQNPAVSLGIAKRGISDLSTDQPVNLIFLLLSPKEQPSRTDSPSQCSRSCRSKQAFAAKPAGVLKFNGSIGGHKAMGDIERESYLK